MKLCHCDYTKIEPIQYIHPRLNFQLMAPTKIDMQIRNMLCRDEIWHCYSVVKECDFASI
jgi:hypothetical protein